MKSLGLVCVLCGMIAVAWSGGMGILGSRVVDWDFVQKVGGIAVEEPVDEGDGKWRMRVQFDPSGLTQITRKPEALNSALLLYGFEAKVEGDAVFVEALLGLPSNRKRERVDGVILPQLENGKEYRVYYGDSIAVERLIGEFKIGK